MGVAGSSFLFACGASAREVGNHQNNIGAGDVVVAVSPNGNTDGHEVGTKQNVGIHSRAENDNEVYNPANDHTLAADVAKVFKSLVEVGANAGGNSTVVEQASEIDATREYANPEYDDAWSALELNNKLSKLSAAQEIETKQNLKSEHGAMYSTAHHSTLDSRAAAKIPTSSFADCDCPSKPHARMVPDAEHDGGVSEAGSECDCSSSGLEEGMQTQKLSPAQAQAKLTAWNGIALLDSLSPDSIPKLEGEDDNALMTRIAPQVRKNVLTRYLRTHVGQVAVSQYPGQVAFPYEFKGRAPWKDFRFEFERPVQNGDIVVIKENPIPFWGGQTRLVVNRVGLVTHYGTQWCTVVLTECARDGTLQFTEEQPLAIHSSNLIVIQRFAQ